MSTVQVVYVGVKPMKEDNIAGTGVVWLGQGDEKPVPLAAWPRLAPHTGVWRLAEQEASRGSKSLDGALVVDDHIKVGALTATGPAVGNITASSLAPVDAIYGTDHPPYIDIDGVEVQLGDLVSAAHVTSGLTVADWNALEDGDRHDFVESEIEKRRTAAADARVRAAAEAAAAVPKPLGYEELKDALTKAGIEFPKQAKKTVLQALYDEHKAKG